MKLLRHFFCDFSLQQMPMVRRLFKDKRNGSITHKIDPLVDGERAQHRRQLAESQQSEEPNLLSSTGPGARSQERSVSR
jgi:hypothetical protein